MIMRGSLVLLLSMLGKNAAAAFRPDFFPDGIPDPLAFYYFNEGSGYDLKESVSDDSTAGSVLFDEDHQINSVHTEPNWVNDEFFGMTIGCGKIENKDNPSEGAIQKDYLSLKDVNYGSSGAWSFSVWFKHEKDVNFPDKEREQFFGHGDPNMGTATLNQVHVQFENSGVVRTIVLDSDDTDLLDLPFNRIVETPDNLNLADGNWHHLVVSTRSDGYGGYNVFVDGVPEASSPYGETYSDPADSDVWLAAGGDPIYPEGPIRLCGREKEDGFDAERYFRGQVAHFALWDSALSTADVSNLYYSYTVEYSIPQVDKPPASGPTPDCPSDPEPCDICGGAIKNPTALVDIAGFPSSVCANVNSDIANQACPSFGITRDDACSQALNYPQLIDLCCGGNAAAFRPDFFPGDIPDPLAFYYFNEGSGYDLTDSVSGNTQAGKVRFDESHQINSVHTEPNWVNDEFFGKTIGCGEIENKANPPNGKIQKDYLTLQDVDYGSSGAWSFSVWFRHEKDVDFPDKEREQFFGHGDPNMGTATINQVHIQFENDGAVRSIIKDSNDADLDSIISVQETPDSLNLADGNWHHLVVSTRSDGYQGYNVYLDGTLDASSPRGEGNSNPADSDIWIAAGGDPIDPDGDIRLCGREKEDGFDAERYFRGQVAHFAVWDSARSTTDVSNLYYSYTVEYSIPQVVKSPVSAPTGTCPVEEPCDICNGPIANPLNVINVAGLPATSCGNVNSETANQACLYGYSAQEACDVVGDTVYDICCVAAETGGSAPVAAPASTESSPSSGGISGGAIVVILAGVSVLVGLGFLAVRKSKSDIDTDFKETESNENTNEETTGDDFVGASL